jgi:signal peptidase
MNWGRAINVFGFIVLLVAVAAFVLQAFPSIVGAEHSLVVRSGSMAPAITTGSVVFVEDAPVESINEGDVITFSKSGTGATTTHRVIEIHEAANSIRFVTKGDANEDRDPEPVYRNDVVGVVTFSIPLIGYVVTYAQTRLGWVLFVLLPVVALIGSELWQLYNALEVVEGDEG